jgi:hypothetical protein
MLGRGGRRLGFPDDHAILPVIKKPREVITPRWGVYALSKKAERIGTVEARDEKHAIERALKETELPKRSQFRISVQREA